MSVRKQIYIYDEDINYQKNIIGHLRSINDEEVKRTGKLKKAFVITYGCQQNENDSEKIKGMLKEMGYAETDNKEEADLILYNTCAVRENAEFKVFGNIGALKNLKKEKPDLIIALCGCMMQQPHIVESIKKKYRHVDLIFGTNNIYKFPELLDRAIEENYMVIDIDSSDGNIAEGLPIVREIKSHALVTIMYGCNNFCTYCIVPYVRGRERSRKPEDVLNEIRKLSLEGVKEVTLLGQNVNSYGKDLESPVDFSDLLTMVEKIEGIERIRFMTSHPKDISDKLVDAISKSSKICHHIHLPFQAGSNKILKAMNRKYSKEDYLDKVRKIRERIADVALTTDIIVGFPGETNDDFEETLDIVRQVEFDAAYTFIYSPREGTPAAKLKDLINKDEVKNNFQKLLDIQNEISYKVNKKYEGQIIKVLVEGISKTREDMLNGRTESGKLVNFNGSSDIINKIVDIEITKATPWYLEGKLN